VETGVDSRGQSATKRDHLARILGDAGTDGPWVERSQGWRPDNSGTSGPGPGSRRPDQPGGPVSSSEAGPWAGGEDRGYATTGAPTWGLNQRNTYVNGRGPERRK